MILSDAEVSKKMAFIKQRTLGKPLICPSYPVLHTHISTQDIPGEITYEVVMGNCDNGCKGCHSESDVSDTYNHIPWERQTSLYDILVGAFEARKKGATSITLMGGTTNGILLSELMLLIDKLSEILPVYLYSGDDSTLDDTTGINGILATLSDLRGIKIGSYKEELGGLDSPSTNQRFYHKDANNEWVCMNKAFCDTCKLTLEDKRKEQALQDKWLEAVQEYEGKQADDLMEGLKTFLNRVDKEIIDKEITNSNKNTNE